MTASDIEIIGEIRNERDTTITSFDMVYSLDGANSDVATIDGLNIRFNETYEFAHPQLASIDIGDHSLELRVENINGSGDDDPNNNALRAQVLCVNEIFSKNVVYEESTGTWCGWCPRGLVGLNTMAHNYNDGTWIGIGVHNNDPMNVPEYDEGLASIFIGYPGGVMNREDVFDPGLSELLPAFLASRQEIPLAKIEVSARTWDAGTREIIVEATSNFAMTLTGISYNVAMVIVESGLTGSTSQWNQINYYSGGSAGDMIDWDGTNWADLPDPVPASDMVYQHIGRVLVGGWGGISGVIPTDVTHGTDYSYEFTHTLSDDFNPANVDLVVMLTDATNGIIVNAAQVKLEGGAILSPDFSADVVNGLAPLEVNFIDETAGGDVATWSWDFDNDGTEDSNEQNPPYSYVNAGDYTVVLTVTNETGDSFTTTKEAFIHCGVGVSELDNANFKCYPNPAIEVINVQTIDAMNSIKIYSVSGQLVYENFSVQSKFHTIDITSYKKGIYFMEISTEFKTKQIKVVVD